MASRLAIVIYVAMVIPILYDNSYSPNDSNLKDASYWDFLKIVELQLLKWSSMVSGNFFATHHRTRYLSATICQFRQL